MPYDPLTRQLTAIGHEYLGTAGFGGLAHMRSHMRGRRLRVSKYRTSIGIVQQFIEMEGVKVHPDTSSNLESEGPLYNSWYRDRGTVRRGARI